MRVQNESLIENTRLIAEFMGAKLEETGFYVYTPKDAPTKHSCYRWSLDEMQYFERWDWLMPVIEKIETLCAYDTFDIEEELETSFVRTFSKNIFRFNGSPLFQGKTKLEAAYKAVNDYITSMNTIPF